MIIEIVFGYFGLLGIGYLFAGYTISGIIRLIGWLAFLGVGPIGIIALSFGTAWIGIQPDSPSISFAVLALYILLICIFASIYIFTPIISGITLRKKMISNN